MRESRAAGTPTAVLLVSDSQAVRRELQGIIESQTDMRLVGLAQSADLPRMVDEAKPEVVIWERASMGTDFLSTTRLVGRGPGRVKIVVVTAHNDSRYALRLLHAGALSCVLTARAREDLPAAVRAATVRSTFISRGIAGITGEDDRA